MISASAQHTAGNDQDILGQLTTQLNIHTASGHIGSNGYRSERTCSRNDLAFLGMPAGIEYIMGNPSLQS